MYHEYPTLTVPFSWYVLLLLKNGKRIGVECKRTDAPTLTPSMRIALSDLKLHKLYVVYPGDRTYPLADNVQAIPLPQMLTSAVPKMA